MARKVGQPIVFLYLHDCLAETCPEHVFAESRHHSVEEDGLSWGDSLELLTIWKLLFVDGPEGPP